MNIVERQLSTERSLASWDNNFATYIPLDCFVASLLAMTKGRRPVFVYSIINYNIMVERVVPSALERVVIQEAC